MIALGDDTDTLAAMAGSLCGAFGGLGAVPAELVERLENDRLGRDHVRKLANRLADRSAPSACEKGPTPVRLKLS